LAERVQNIIKGMGLVSKSWNSTIKLPTLFSPPTTRIMVELQSIFKKAYWTLAAGGLLYVLFICAITFPEVQRL